MSVLRKLAEEEEEEEIQGYISEIPFCSLSQRLKLFEPKLRIKQSQCKALSCEPFET